MNYKLTIKTKKPYNSLLIMTFRNTSKELIKIMNWFLKQESNNFSLNIPVKKLYQTPEEIVIYREQIASILLEVIE